MIGRRARGRGRQFEVEQIARAGQMEGAGLGQQAAALFEEVGDVFAGVGPEGVRIGQGAVHRVRTVDLGEGDDLFDVVTHVEPPLRELGVIRGRDGREREETQKSPLVARLLALVEQGLHVVGVLVIAAAVKRAHMVRDQGLAVEESQPVARQLQGQGRRGVARRHRVTVRIDRHATAVAHRDRAHEHRLIGIRRQGPQVGAFLGEHRGRRALGFAVLAHVGHRFEPDTGRRVEGGESAGRGEVAAGEEVFLHVADGVFHPAFGLRLPRSAGFDGKTVVPRKIKVVRVAHRRFAHAVREHGGFAVVGHHFRRHRPERF